MEPHVITIPIVLAEKLWEACCDATSKLESQVVRNPDLPEGYKDAVAKSLDCLRWLGECIRSKQEWYKNLPSIQLDSCHD